MLMPVRATAPVEKPVTLAEVKAHCRVDSVDDDLLLSGLIDAATDHLDGYAGILGRCLVEQEWRLDLPCFPADMLRLPLGNLIGTSSVKYYDSAGVFQTLAVSEYDEAEDSIGPFVVPKTGKSWPSTDERTVAVQVLWYAGYGAATDVPMAIRQALLLLIGHWYENREASIAGVTAMPLPFAVEALLAPYRRRA